MTKEKNTKPEMESVPFDQQTEDVTTVVAEEIPLEETISNTLVKRNITEDIIASLKKDAAELIIKDANDKEGYLAVSAKRKEIKKWVALTKEVCKAGREDAIKVQKAWIAKEDEIVQRFKEIHDPLSKMEDEYEAENEKRKLAEKQRLDAVYTTRTQELIKMGASFDGANFVLQDVSIESVLIREADEEIYQDKIFPRFKVIFDANELKRIEDERLKKEAQDKIDEENRKLQEERDAFAKQQEDFKKQQDDLNRQKEAIAKKEKEEKDRVVSRRIEHLNNLGLKFNYQRNAYVYKSVVVDAFLSDCDNEKWSKLILEITLEIDKEKQIELDEQKKKDEQKRKEEIAAALKKQKDDEAAAEKAKQDEIEKMNDKDKWATFIFQLENLYTPEMKSKSYKDKAQNALYFIEQIKAL